MFAIRKADGSLFADEFGEPLRFGSEAEAAQWRGAGETIVLIAPQAARPAPPKPAPSPRFQIIGSDDVPAWLRNREKRRE